MKTLKKIGLFLIPLFVPFCKWYLKQKGYEVLKKPEPTPKEK